MKQFSFYQTRLKVNNENEVFNCFFEKLKRSNDFWRYFADWEHHNIHRDVELVLNQLNFLVGKEDFDEEFCQLIGWNAHCIKYLPVIAFRNGECVSSFRISVDYRNKKFVCDDYDFDNPNPAMPDIEKYLGFLKRTNWVNLIQSKQIHNLVDYIYGVDYSLGRHDNQAREKASMNAIVKVFVEDLCKKKQYRYLKEANATKIYSEWGINVPVDKSSRRYDFVINNGHELFIVETNFYGGGGSKLKSTAGEYRNLFDVLDNKFKFIWITDGLGWNSAKLPLRETFEHNDYVFNLDMLEKGVLEELI